jgi:hypothetical protein
MELRTVGDRSEDLAGLLGRSLATLEHLRALTVDRDIDRLFPPLVEPLRTLPALTKLTARSI